MNILVYSHVATWEQHHAESIEIANKCLDQGHNVFYLSCDSSLKNCPANYFKNRNYCKECLLQTEYTNKKILSEKIHKIYLKTEKKKN
jgi:UDP-2,3-diacylglucosamine pyrophosphatase LpxH